MIGTTLRLPPSRSCRSARASFWCDFFTFDRSTALDRRSARAVDMCMRMFVQLRAVKFARTGRAPPIGCTTSGSGYHARWTPPASVARPVARCWPSCAAFLRRCFSTADVASLYLRRPTFSRRTVPRCSPPRSCPSHRGWIEPTGAVQRHAGGQVVAVDAAPADEQPRSDEPPRSSRALVQEQGWTTSRSCRQQSAGTCRPRR